MSEAEGVQEDFGGFDPRFPGVTVHVGSQRVWEYLDMRLRGGLPKIPPISASPTLAFEALCASSVVYHEVRHFHDFLLSPYSATIFRLRASTAVNCVQLLPQLLDDDTNLIPVPLPAWIELDDPHRARQLASFAYFEPAPRVPEFPRFVGPPPVKPHGLHEVHLDSPLARSKLVSQLAGTYGTLRGLTFSEAVSGTGNTFQSWQVFELTALLVQIQSIWSEHGRDECEHFHETVRSDATPYGRALGAARRPWDKCARPFDPRTAICMAVWSYCGDFESDGDGSTPLHRFAALFRHLLTSGVPKPGSDARQLMKTWSDVTGLCEPALALERDAARFDRFRAVIAQQYEQSDCQPLLERTRILEVVEALAVAKRRMREAFLEEPEIMVNPLAYLQALRVLPDPALRIVMGEESVLFGQRDRVERAGYEIETYADVGSGNVHIKELLLNGGATCGKTPAIAARDARDCAGHFTLVDALLNRQNRSNWEMERIRQFWASRGKVLAEVILDE